VSNSSSSSFIVVYKKPLPKKIDLKFIKTGILNPDFKINFKTYHGTITNNSIANYLLTGKGQDFHNGNISSELSYKLNVVDKAALRSQVLRNIPNKKLLEVLDISEGLLELYLERFSQTFDKEASFYIDGIDCNFFVQVIIYEQLDLVIDKKDPFFLILIYLLNTETDVNEKKLFKDQLSRYIEMMIIVHLNHSIQLINMDNIFNDDTTIQKNAKKEKYEKDLEIFIDHFYEIRKTTKSKTPLSLDAKEDELYNTNFISVQNFIYDCFSDVIDYIETNSDLKFNLFTFDSQGAGDGWHSVESEHFYRTGTNNGLYFNEDCSLRSEYEFVRNLVEDFLRSDYRIDKLKEVFKKKFIKAEIN